jgi:hypothetical protein
MKIDRQSLLLGMLIGILAGGLAIGILDAKRPQPLFSAADEKVGNCEEVKPIRDEINNTMTQIRGLVNDGTKLNADAIKQLSIYVDQLEAVAAGGCGNIIE